MNTAFYKKPLICHLAIHLLLKANHKPNSFIFNGKKEIINTGQVLTGSEALAKESGLSRQEVRTALSVLCDPTIGFSTIRSTNRFSVISIAKYKEYQEKSTSTSTNKQPTTNQQLTTNNNDKNEKNEKKGERAAHDVPSLGEVRTFIQGRGFSVDPVLFFNHYESKGWAGIKSWKALLEKWEAQDAKKREEKESPQYREAKENRRRELEEANHD